MTDDEMRIAIAEACGWKPYKPITHDGWPLLMTPPKKPNKEGWLETIPDYLNDLNAMHEAEKTFADDDVIAEKYWLALYDATEHTRWPYDATARQRCIAYLKTKGILP